MRSDDVCGRSDASRGRIPLVRICHKRGGFSVPSAVTNKGDVRWIALDGAMKSRP